MGFFDLIPAKAEPRGDGRVPGREPAVRPVAVLRLRPRGGRVRLRAADDGVRRRALRRVADQTGKMLWESVAEQLKPAGEPTWPFPGMESRMYDDCPFPIAVVKLPEAKKQTEAHFVAIVLCVDPKKEKPRRRSRSATSRWSTAGRAARRYWASGRRTGSTSTKGRGRRRSGKRFTRRCWAVRRGEGVNRRTLFVVLVLLWRTCRDGMPPQPLAGLALSHAFGERQREWTSNGARLLMNLAGDFDPARPTRLVMYARPTGTRSSRRSAGTQPGLDWHFDIQHVAAQVRSCGEVDAKREHRAGVRRGRGTELAGVEAASAGRPGQVRRRRGRRGRGCRARSARRARRAQRRRELPVRLPRRRRRDSAMASSASLPRRQLLLQRRRQHGDKLLAWLKGDRPPARRHRLRRPRSHARRQDGRRAGRRHVPRDRADARRGSHAT